MSGPSSKPLSCLLGPKMSACTLQSVTQHDVGAREILTKYFLRTVTAAQQLAKTSFRWKHAALVQACRFLRNHNEPLGAAAFDLRIDRALVRCVCGRQWCQDHCGGDYQISGAVRLDTHHFLLGCAEVRHCTRSTSNTLQHHRPVTLPLETVPGADMLASVKSRIGTTRIESTWKHVNSTLGRREEIPRSSNTRATRCRPRA